LIRATVLICAHNEEQTIGQCLASVLRQSHTPELVVIVADRCTDRTVSIVQGILDGRPSLILEKKRVEWKYSISENLQIGLQNSIGDALVIIDADIIVPSNFLEVLLPELTDFAVVSALVRTDPSKGTLNRLVASWEMSYAFSPVGEQPRGGARAVSMGPLKTLGGFRDVYAWESDLDTRLRKSGYKVKLDRRVSVLHRRKMTLSRSIAYQVQAGKARRELGVSPIRTIFHSIVRLRPFVIVGYFAS